MRAPKETRQCIDYCTASSRCGVKLSSGRLIRVKPSNVSAIPAVSCETAKAPESIRASTQPEDSREPQRPPGAQFLFIIGMRSKYGQSFSSSAALQMWNDLEMAERAKYEHMSAKLNEQYQVDLRRWRDTFCGPGAKEVSAKARAG